MTAGRQASGKSSSGSSPEDPAPGAVRRVEEVDTVTIRFCGDSGDGMQLAGSEFTRASAIAGNDLQTFPDYPAEIRAPAGTLPGVSGFQIQFSSHPVYTPGDQPDVLVAMNPAALRTNLADLARGGMLVLNSGAFTLQNLAKAGYAKDPRGDGSLSSFRVYEVDVTKLTEAALAGSGLGAKEVGFLVVMVLVLVPVQVLVCRDILAERRYPKWFAWFALLFGPMGVLIVLGLPSLPPSEACPPPPPDDPV